ncbi:MAG: type II toxin-antitoxin system PemK/MazF family toxin [Pseudobutyrivibrio sp.]|nr:type II toxin-antitoxin system PemK/MazF family toxin [Pseudobutyrivibrio sp.]
MVVSKVEQGDILKFERIKQPVLVISKNFFNEENEIMGCPIFKTNDIPSPLHIEINYNDGSGVVHCEQVHLLDLNLRGYKRIGRISIEEIMNITDAIQSIFDYI